MSEYLLSVRDFPEQPPERRWVAVISQGGHPVINPDAICEVVDVNTFATQQECYEWFERMMTEAPWETRQ